jgi:hypothetical protein
MVDRANEYLSISELWSKIAAEQNKGVGFQ